MVVLQLYSKSIKKRYKNTLFSKATLFIFVTTILNVIIPFVLVYKSKDFWLKYDTFYEQPNVKFKHLYLLNALTNNNNNNELIICNNFLKYQQYSQLDVCNSVKVQEIDANVDGKIDELNFYITMDLSDGTKLYAINLLLLLDYTLQTMCPVNLEMAAILQQVFPPHTTHFTTISELSLSQSVPLECNRFKTYTISNIISDINNNDDDEASYKFESIFETYLSRNITTHLSKVYTTVGRNPSNKFSLTLKIKYPTHKVWYKRGFWQLMKWAWIQYLPTYIIIFCLIKKMRDYVFDNRLLLYYEESPLKKRL